MSCCDSLSLALSSSHSLLIHTTPPYPFQVVLGNVSTLYYKAKPAQLSPFKKASTALICMSFFAIHHLSHGRCWSPLHWLVHIFVASTKPPHYLACGLQYLLPGTIVTYRLQGVFAFSSVLYFSGHWSTFSHISNRFLAISVLEMLPGAKVL